MRDPSNQRCLARAWRAEHGDHSAGTNREDRIEPAEASLDDRAERKDRSCSCCHCEVTKTRLSVVDKYALALPVNCLYNERVRERVRPRVCMAVMIVLLIAATALIADVRI